MAGAPAHLIDTEIRAGMRCLFIGLESNNLALIKRGRGWAAGRARPASGANKPIGISNFLDEIGPTNKQIPKERRHLGAPHGPRPRFARRVSPVGTCARDYIAKLMATRGPLLPPFRRARPSCRRPGGSWARGRG